MLASFENENNELAASDAGVASSSSRKRNGVLFGAVVLLWIAFDQVTKLYFNGFQLGDLVAGPFAGLFQFRLVHNIGAAWGMFGGAVIPLAVLSVLVCLALAAYLFIFAPESSGVTALGIALVVAGGIGNAIDRFTLGYVVDFIEPVFIEFPVFNIADIGVTCGFVIFFLGMILEYRCLAKEEPSR